MRKKRTPRKVKAKRCSGKTAAGKRCKNVSAKAKCHLHTRRTKKTKKAKKSKAHTTYYVFAHFKPTKKQDRQAFGKKIIKAARRKPIGSGCHLKTGKCDIDFEFKSLPTSTQT